jgi:hypothetical protein
LAEYAEFNSNVFLQVPQTGTKINGKNLFLCEFDILKKELYVKQLRPQNMNEGFWQVSKITIAKLNLALWSKSVGQRLQDEVVKMLLFHNPFLFSLASL